jgi:hypothetical protein
VGWEDFQRGKGLDRIFGQQRGKPLTQRARRRSAKVRHGVAGVMRFAAISGKKERAGR